MSERERALLRDEVARRRIANDRESARLEALPPRQMGSPGHLTVKQLRTVQRWADGYTFKELAEEDGVSVSSIAARVNAAKYKLNVPPMTGRGFSVAADRRRVRAALCAEAA